MYYTYIIECCDNTLYTGVAKDIDHRLKIHEKKIKATAKYTRSHSYKELKALWESEDRSSAQKLEYRIKRLSREKKIALIENDETVSSLFDMLESENYRRIYIKKKTEAVE